MGIFCQGFLRWSERDLKNHGIAYCYYSFPQVYLLSMLGSQKPKTNRNHCNIVQNGIGIDNSFKLFYQFSVWRNNIFRVRSGKYQTRLIWKVQSPQSMLVWKCSYANGSSKANNLLYNLFLRNNFSCVKFGLRLNSSVHSKCKDINKNCKDIYSII